MYKVRTDHDHFEIAVSKVPDGWVSLGRGLAVLSFFVGFVSAVDGWMPVAVVSVLPFLGGIALEDLGKRRRVETIVRVNSAGICIVDGIGVRRIDWRSISEVTRHPEGLMLLVGNHPLSIGVGWPSHAVDELCSVLLTAHQAQPPLPDRTPPEALQKLLQSKPH